MTFADIGAADTLFVDANTFVYHFTNDPTFGLPCRQLLERCARQEIILSTSTHVLSDVAHRLMTAEAVKLFGWAPAGIVRQLRQHAAEIHKLSIFRRALDEIPQFGVRLLSVSPPFLPAAATLSQQFGLLSGDALIVAVMQDQIITRIASNDTDFDRVPGISRYAPA